MLVDTLRVRIERDGPMPFEEFMAASLYDPVFGFFATGPLRSDTEGDFLTSPEISPWFGRTIARALRTELGAAGWGLVEVGAGSGSLLRPLLDELGVTPQPTIAVDRSPAARERLGRLPGVRITDSLDGIALSCAAVVANELLDNLPVALAVATSDGWQERWVGIGDRLGLVGRPARPEVAAWCDRYAGRVPEGGLVEVQLEAERWLRRLLGAIESGVVLLIDYGGTAEELEPRRTQGTLRTYRSHHLGPDPFLEPGSTDITVDVNFTAVLAVAEDCGWSAELHRQDDFLVFHGLRDELRRMRDEERNLATGTDTMGRLRVRSEHKDAETLLHPRGLGDFRVAVLRREGTGVASAGV